MAETKPPGLQITIIGAGIAGLGAAIALKKHPAIDVQIYERAAELQEIGASIALGPNGMRTLERLGVNNALDESVAFRNKSGFPMIYRHYQTNEVVSVDTHRGHVDPLHHTARFYRAHLQQALLKHVDLAQIHLSKSFRSVAARNSEGKLIITFHDGTTATTDILLGADGIRSRVRTFLVPTSATAWTGWVAFRSVFPISHVAHISGLPDEATHFWGPNGRTLFTSPLGKDLFTVVASHQSDPSAADAPYSDAVWDEDGDVSVFREFYQDWSPLAQAIVAATPHTSVYPNAAARGLDTWVLSLPGDSKGGRVTLAGDAAHAHGGAFAAGGSLALDDAWAFAAAVMHVFPPGSARKPTEEDVGFALRLYEATRKKHTDKVIRAVHEGNGEKVAKALRETETDEALRERMKSRGDPAWIHEHDVLGEFQRALGELKGENDAVKVVDVVVVGGEQVML
ncbi:hypothetical protein B0H63DRAFT_515195 [Podospora didyma]|uniref:FAD-binding domain-containing protein n=1 Tax=Podospora didyma TaxID=330526 RepID=A0AAE0N414_9PEZI|nr:hypothetical protein B0H63DRAFT_515195 [Podospora didyma]